jgi:glucokinase
MGQQHSVWVGVDIGGTKTAVVASRNLPEILARIEFSTLPQQGPERAIGLIKDSIDQVIRDIGCSRTEVQAIGVSCGGPLNRSTGVIQAPPNLSTWVDVPITSILREEFQTECRLENDADAGAVAEFRFGAGRGTEHMIFLTMGTGLGAGIIAGGSLYRGATGNAGEIGHVRLSETGPVGYHKAGSVEGWASGGGMAQIAVQEVKAAVQRGTHTELGAALDQKGIIAAKDVAEAAERGDRVAAHILEISAFRLGQTLAVLVDVLNPERIVIGGLAMRLGERILKPARAVLASEALEQSVKVCQVVPASLGEAIGDVASLCVAMGF